MQRVVQLTTSSWLQFDPATTDFASATPSGNTSAAASPSEASAVELALGVVYFILTGVTGVLSMFSCVALVVTFAALGELQTTGRRLLVCLSVADFLTAFGNLVGIVWYASKDRMDASVGEGLCQFHAALTIFSSISSFFWSTSVGVHLYVCVCLRDAKMADRMFWAFVVVCWTPAAIIAIVSWFLGVLGHDPAAKGPSWCWIKPEVNVVTSLFWQYMTGKCWEMTCYFITAITYALIRRRLPKQKKVGGAAMTQRAAAASDVRGAKNDVRGAKSDVRGAKNDVRGAKSDVRGAKRPNTSLIAETNRKLVFVPLIFVALRIWGTIRFIIGAHFANAPGVVYALLLIVPLQGIGDSAQGLANYLLFCCFTKRVRQLCLRTLPYKGRKVKPHSTTVEPPPPEATVEPLPSANQTISAVDQTNQQDDTDV